MKHLEINVNGIKGHVEIYDPLPLVKLATFEEAVKDALKIDSRLATAKSHVAIIPALIECVAEWHLSGFPVELTVDTFPGIGTGISKRDITEVINLITNEVLKFLKGDDPNA